MSKAWVDMESSQSSSLKKPGDITSQLEFDLVSKFSWADDSPDSDGGTDDT